MSSIADLWWLWLLIVVSAALWGTFRFLNRMKSSSSAFSSFPTSLRFNNPDHQAEMLKNHSTSLLSGSGGMVIASLVSGVASLLLVIAIVVKLIEYSHTH